VGLGHAELVRLMPVQAIVNQDFSKGSNVSTNPWAVGKQQSILVVNMTLDEQASLRTRDGTSLLTTSPDTPPDIRPIVKLFDYVKADGTVIHLAIIRGSSGFNQLYNYGTVGWTLIGTLGTQYAVPDILTFTNLALIANGYEVPWSYDGTSLIPLIDTPTTGSVPPGALHHTLHQGYYWVWNTAPASAGSGVVTPTTAYVGPSALQSSDLNNPNSWPLANQIFIDKDDGDQGMGMGQFTIAESGISPSTSQILFKTYKAYQMTGVFGSTSPAFAIQKIKSDMGCVAPRTIQFAPGFGLLRMTHRGVSKFNGVDDKLVSEEIRPIIFGSDLYIGLDWANIGTAVAAVVSNPPLYLCAVPVVGTPGLTRVLCYDLVREAWTILTYPFAIASLAAHFHVADPPHLLMGGYSDGKIHHTEGQETDDEGTPISWQWLPRPASAPSPQANGFFRRLVLKVTNVVAGQLIDVTVVFGPAVSNPPQTISKSLVCPVAVGLGLGFGIQPFGTSPFGGTGTNAEADLTMDLGLIATNARAIIGGTGPIRIRGIEYHVSPKPLRRVSVYTEQINA
jgi:hypothetical protein